LAARKRTWGGHYSGGDRPSHYSLGVNLSENYVGVDIVKIVQSIKKKEVRKGNYKWEEKKMHATGVVIRAKPITYPVKKSLEQRKRRWEKKEFRERGGEFTCHLVG